MGLNFSFKTLLQLSSYPCEAFLSRVVDKTFSKVRLFQETSPAPKNTWLHPCFLCCIELSKCIYITIFLSTGR